MKAWEIRHGRLGLHHVRQPHPRLGEVTVHVGYAGICGSDLPKLTRPDDFALPRPWRPGHEIVGTDLAGRTVAIDPLVPCATCPRCAAGDIHLCPRLQRLGWDLPGGFAEQVTVSRENAHALPTGLDPLYAVLTDPAAVAVHGLRCNPIGAPGRLAVIGAGAVGLLTALYAHDNGWVVTVVHRHRRSPDTDITRAIPAAFHPSHDLAEAAFDAVVDTATGGDATPLELALRLVRDGGAIIVQNAYHPGVRLPTPLRELFCRSIRLIGCFSHCRAHTTADFVEAMRLLRAHNEQITPLISVSGTLADLPTVIRHPRRSLRQALTT